MPKLYVALENIRSLYNLGAVFRTCSFFGVYDVLLVGYTGKDGSLGDTFLNDKVKKSSLGSEKDLNLHFINSTQELLQFAHDKSIDLVAVEQSSKSTSLRNFTVSRDTVLVFGNEVSGVSEEVQENSSQLVEIPRLGAHGSLNVTTCLGIVLYALC